jgi:alkylation response protein AidB-like acyl-CoA dehydrogenase
MDWERICLFASHVGTMERLLEQAQARTSVQFGQKIGKFQAVSHKIADMKVLLEAARLLVYRAERAVRDAPGRTIYSGTSEMQRNIIGRFLGL